MFTLGIYKLALFSDLAEARKFIEAHPQRNSLLFLVDYEFKNTEENGLSLIETLAIAEQSILVTSHAKNDTILQKCQWLGVKVLSKTAMSSVPIRTTKGAGLRVGKFSETADQMAESR